MTTTTLPTTYNYDECGYWVSIKSGSGHQWRAQCRGQLLNHPRVMRELSTVVTHAHTDPFEYRPDQAHLVSVCLTVCLSVWSGLSHTVCVRKQGGAWAQGKCVTLTECTLFRYRSCKNIFYYYIILLYFFFFLNFK